MCQHVSNMYMCVVLCVCCMYTLSRGGQLDCNPQAPSIIFLFWHCPYSATWAASFPLELMTVSKEFKTKL